MTEMHYFAVYRPETGEVLQVSQSTNPAVVDLARERMPEGAALYEGEIDPATTYLPGGMPTPKPDLAPVVTAMEVKAHAGRLLSYTDWYVTRHQETGADTPSDILAYRQAVRDASGLIEAMEPIPADYRDPKYWPAQP